ncbi:bile acid:sodium symporter family protein [Falsirhodobacter halotolerans]|uniref:bile acid:sodium symporter family protein n=1 Tax=Falsirhodobacter halotolerans TaxID=1146892 RepID=UPI001FD03503|nr:bile acid:sodium symporter family protein [Falsirhodobacter halotolerans]MCJ8140167.1 bile acid:sodium symporter [Falsirhodobacter halotolerans]
MGILKRFGIDGYMMLLIGMVVLGAVVPAQGMAAVVLGYVTMGAIALLFFLYGVRMNAAEVMAGLTNWRLQSLSFGITFVMFPIFGIGVAWAARPLIGDELALGLLFLSVLPSTINSSIALTGMAGGNVSGAICSATLSNLLGVFLTPALAAVLLHSGGGGASGDAVLKIALQILLPFVLGQCLRRWLSDFVRRRKMLTTVVDRGAILLIVYAAFSAGTTAGLWRLIPPVTLGTLIAVVLVFLALGMVAVRLIGRISGMNRPDRTALFFCGSTKSLASGLPIAAALFAPDMIGLMILPVMIFHMSQLLVCAVIAQRAAAPEAAAQVAS